MHLTTRSANLPACVGPHSAAESAFKAMVYKTQQHVEDLKVAFCLTGASRSLPTVPVLRGFKKNVLQSRQYISAAFAALSLSPAVPGVHDSNMTLANKLSNVLYVQRAMMRLQPEVRAR